MITEQQLKQCIEEIGLLAISTSSRINKQITVYEGVSEDAGIEYFPTTQLLATAANLLDLAKTVKDSWYFLEKRPLKTFSKKIAPVDTKRLHSSPISLIQTKLNPTKKQVLGVTHVESHECIENEFICYVLDVYLKDLASGIAKSLDSIVLEEIIIPPISQKIAAIRSDFIAVVRKRVKKRNSLIEDEKKRILDMASKLDDCVKWAMKARQANFIKNIRTPNEVPIPSLRLAGSPAYSSIFKKYLNCRTTSLVAIKKVLYLYKCTFQGQVRPTWEIYKIWCVVRLYSTLIMYTNMQPPKGESKIFECIKLKKGTLELPKNKPFKLIGKLNNGHKFSITFWYQPIVHTSSEEIINPDIKLEIVIGSGTTLQYCFDILERNYAQQGVDQFLDDIKIVRNIYLHGLGTKASFILHTDKQFDYWGEVGIRRILKETFNQRTKDTRYEKYVGHRYGAISLIPGANADRQFKKILQLLFKYHNNSLKTACLSCGDQLKHGRDVVPSWRPSKISESELINRTINGRNNAGNGTGVYCCCPKCADFWVVQICWRNHHPLLKLIDCFHRNSDHPEFYGKWMYICPVCGSDPSLADLGY